MEHPRRRVGDIVEHLLDLREQPLLRRDRTLPDARALGKVAAHADRLRDDHRADDRRGDDERLHAQTPLGRSVEVALRRVGPVGDGLGDAVDAIAMTTITMPARIASAGFEKRPEFTTAPSPRRR